MTDLQQYLIEEFVEEYQQGRLTRREALRRIAAVTGSLALSTSILAACGSSAKPAATTRSGPAPATPDPAASAQSAATPAAIHVSPDDPAIEAGNLQFPGENVTLLGYFSQPKGDGPSPGVLVCHENRGLTEHIKDVTRRLAKAGYVGLAVDLLSRQGGTETIRDPAQVPGILGNTPPEQFVQDFRSGLRYLQTRPEVRKERIGMIGFCFGGGVAWRCATQLPELRAAVPFYGPNPPLENVPNIQAAVLAIYGEQDQRINQGIPAIEAAMQQSHKTFEKVIYPNAGHAFFNDTGPNYNPEAAAAAWSRTLNWFEQYLRT